MSVNRNRPPAVTDPDGDTGLWTDGDKHGVPGYQWAGGVTIPRSPVGLGPAHTREHVESGGYKVHRG